MNATEIGQRLKKARLNAGLTQKDAATKLGITYQAISNYERGINRVDTDTLTRLCIIYNIRIVDLLGNPLLTNEMFEEDKNATNDEQHHIYIQYSQQLIEKLNDLRKSDPSPLAPEDEHIRHAYHNEKIPTNIIPMPDMRKIPLIGAIACGAPILADEHIEDYINIPARIPGDFALTCKGDSMINARIFDGDIVYIRQQETVENGEIAAVLIDGEATLKRVKFFDDHIVLEPENPHFRPLTYWGEEMNTIRILGKAVAFTSTIR